MRGFSGPRALSVARKEIRHVRRDPFTLAMAVGVPVLLVVFFGYVLDFDVRDIRLRIVDRDNTPASRALAEAFTASGYFKPHGPPAVSALRLLAEGRVKAAVFIEPGFAEDIARGIPARAQVVIDGADNQTAGVIAGYLDGVATVAARRLGADPPADLLRTRFLFNNELNSRWFVVTGLFVVVMGVLSILMTALTVAREWETGSMELLLSTPVRPLEMILGKLAPYLGLCLASTGLIYAAARLLFHVPFRGSLWFFLAANVLFLCCTLAQGLLISVLTRQQQLAMQFSNLTGLLPALLLSGFIFPVESMPAFFRILTWALPARHFMELCRGIILKGAGPLELARPALWLAGLAAALIGWASVKFKRDLEP